MGISSILAMMFCMLNLHYIPITGNVDKPNKALQRYIVRLKPGLRVPATVGDDLETWYNTFLPTRFLASSSGAKPRIVHAYRHVFLGFAAKLSSEDVEAVQRKPGVVSVTPDKKWSLFTTRSPNFLGLFQNSGFWNISNYGRGVVIGMIDSGIKPDHPSFNDNGVPEPPAKWKGKCKFDAYPCNNKLIRAMSANKSLTPYDDGGHGTHTASTAAGNFVEGANFYGKANGTASGIAPLAHLAIYKVCDREYCPQSDIIAGWDAAIDDGVDVISMSLGYDPETIPIYNDTTSIAAYKAMEKGIFVSCAAANYGPLYRSLSNDAPWMLTVGASTIDRTLEASVMLGNKEELPGQALYQPIHSTEELQLVLSESVGGRRFCDKVMDLAKTKGKIVVCDISDMDLTSQQGEVVQKSGGAAMITINIQEAGEIIDDETNVIPGTHLTYRNGLKLKAYMNSTVKPTAKIIFKGTKIGDKNAPIAATFSSRGPSRQTPRILKPDIIGPGVNILAAWPKSMDNKINTKSTFSIESGTSMSCPHLSGVAALIKSVHPSWSPAAIKSAIMTTADHVNHAGNPIPNQNLNPANIFSMGAGHVNPSRASDPGLIYDIKPKDYIPLLCGLNYTNNQVSLIVQHEVDCAKEKKISQTELNYPSFSILFGESPQTYTRTVTNVGDENSSYEVKIVPPDGVNVQVEPTKLTFTKDNQQLSYKVTFARSHAASKTGKFGNGFITWNSVKHTVRSPIAVIFNSSKF